MGKSKLTLNNVQSDIVLGENAGIRLHHDLNEATKSIYVLSPYVSSNFTDLLITKSYQGVNVMLISTDDRAAAYDKTGQRDNIARVYAQTCFTDNDEALRKQQALSKIQKKRRLLNFVTMFVCIFIGFMFRNRIETYENIFLYILAAEERKYLFSLFVFFPIMIAYGNLKHDQEKARKIKLYSYSYRTLIDFKIIKRNNSSMIHTKLYIIDDSIAYLGSLNFTNNGLHRNVESAIRISSIEDVKKLKEYYLSFLESGSGIEFYSVDEIARMYFTEKSY